jgi:hypothetical protein
MEKLEKLRKERSFRVLDVIGVGKKVRLNLVGLNGNAYSLMSKFSIQAKKEGWDMDEIDYVITKCKSGDYNNLLCVLMNHCEMDSENISIDRDENDLPDVVYVNGVTYRKI